MRMMMRPRRRRFGQSGQSLVETAVILPVFFFVFFGLVDGARLVYSNAVVSEAARQGARVAAAEAAWIGITDATDPACVSSPAGIGGGNPGAHVCPPSGGAMHANVVAAVNQAAGTIGTVDGVYVDCVPEGGSPPTGNWTGGNDCSGATGFGKGSLVSVRVVYTYHPIAPLISAVPGMSTVVLSGAATMYVN